MSSLDNIKKKIHPDAVSAEKVIRSWREKHYSVVFTNGCFDLIHRGHIEILSKASDLGDKLIIGLNSDKSVKSIKGPSRPIQDEYSRALILSSFSFVDLVIFFSEDTPYNLIKTVKPDVLVKGGDYRAEDIVGYDIVSENNGKVVTIDFVEGFSTTRIINKMKN